MRLRLDRFAVGVTIPVGAYRPSSAVDSECGCELLVEVPMAVSTCRVDAEGRVVLPPSFIGKTVTLAVVSESEVRVRLLGSGRSRPSLRELLARVTEANLPEKADFGQPVGEEQL
jgi:hypothetical protein